MEDWTLAAEIQFKSLVGWPCANSHPSLSDRALMRMKRRAIIPSGSLTREKNQLNKILLKWEYPLPSRKIRRLKGIDVTNTFLNSIKGIWGFWLAGISSLLAWDSECFRTLFAHCNTSDSSGPCGNLRTLDSMVKPSQSWLLRDWFGCKRWQRRGGSHAWSIWDSWIGVLLPPDNSRLVPTTQPASMLLVGYSHISPWMHFICRPSQGPWVPFTSVHPHPMSTRTQVSCALFTMGMLNLLPNGHSPTWDPSNIFLREHSIWKWLIRNFLNKEAQSLWCTLHRTAHEDNMEIKVDAKYSDSPVTRLNGNFFIGSFTGCPSKKAHILIWKKLAHTEWVESV